MGLDSIQLCSIVVDACPLTDTLSVLHLDVSLFEWAWGDRTGWSGTAFPTFMDAEEIFVADLFTRRGVGLVHDGGSSALIMRFHKKLCVGPVVVGLVLGGVIVVSPAEADAPPISTLATPGQLLMDHLSEHLAAAPAVQAEATKVMTQWNNAVTAKLGPLSAQNESLLAPAIEQLTYGSAQVVADGDPDHPVVSWIEAPPHTWFGNEVPGGRFAGDNPDTVYRMIPIDGVSTYQISGRFVGAHPANTLFQLVVSPSWTGVDSIGTDINGTDSLVVNPDGTFSVSVGPGPANGQTNYMQTTATDSDVYIRDTLSDWSTQSAPYLSVRRIAGPAPGPRPTFSQQVASTVSQLSTWGTLWLNTDILGVQMAAPANTFPALIYATGGIWRDFPNFDLAPNQALVITTNLAGATYVGIPVQNIWTVSADYWDHQSSLTNAQARPNPDGTYTFVVSSRDPGVYNWVDTTGLQQGTMVLRWQGVPLGNVPSVSGQVVDLSNLSSVLPAGTVFVTPSQRANQLAQREAGFEARVAPGVPGDLRS